MKLEHTFTVDAPAADVWRALRDLGASAALLPRAQVTSSAPDRAEGTFQAKLGPMNLRYTGLAEVLKADDDTRTAVLRAEGVNAKHGPATATVTVRLTAADGSTTVHLTSDVTAAGRPGEFDREAFSEVGSRVVGRFAEAFTAALAAAASAEAPTEATGEAPGEQTREDQPLPRRPRPRPAPADGSPASGPQEPVAQAVPTPAVDTPDAVDRTGPDTPVSVDPPVRSEPVGRRPEAVAPAGRPAPDSASGGLRRAVDFVTQPTLVRGVAPAVLATIFVLGAVRRRRRS